MVSAQPVCLPDTCLPEVWVRVRVWITPRGVSFREFVIRRSCSSIIFGDTIRASEANNESHSEGAERPVGE